MIVRASRRLGLGLSLALTLALAATPVIGQQGPRGGQGPAPGGGPFGGRGMGGAPIRDTAAQTAVGSATVSGLVVVEGAGTPVRRARVSLAAPELRGGRSVLTDDQGRFTFNALPAGRFTLTASKSGFVDIAYGAKRAGRPGTPIQITEGQTLDDLRLALPRGAVITGIVVDEHGEPAAGTPVRALRFVMQTGERRLQQAGQDQTDDRGMYRIFQLQPGEYIVNAAPRNLNVGDARQALASEIASLMQQLQASGVNPALPQAAAGQGSAATARLAQLQRQMATYEQEQPAAYAPVYFPGTTDPDAAVAITVNAGEERAGVDFRLQQVPTTRVGGLIVTTTGNLPPATQVALVPRSASGTSTVPGLGNMMARVGGDGRFSFENVTPGAYSLQARATLRDATTAAATTGRGRGPGQGPVSQVLWAVTDLSVNGQPLPDIVLTLQPGMTISGQVRFEGTATPPADLSVVRIALASRGAQAFEMGGLPPVTADANGRFAIPGVSPGRYTLTATMAGGGRGAPGRGGGILLDQMAAAGSGSWQLASAMSNGRDLLDDPIDIGPNQNLQNVILTYTDKVQELTGTIQDTSGGPTSDFTIIVFPAETRYWQPQARRIAATRPGTDGRFTFRGLPPGEYRLTAVTDVEPGEWYDPAFLEQLAHASIPIAIGNGEKKVQDIRLAGSQ
ncbi:MAG: hypothetical protein ABS36_02425 [Acidobacteria bacterium SCN 69-37]|nr:MAG: hypothetical protein ABS36_02425 [Acidobacteria bacterium SCN 69-37]